MMLLGIDWFVVKDSRRKAAINVLFLCEMVVSLYVVGFCFMYNIHDVHLPISILFFQVNNIIRTFHDYRNKV
jgi:hypoxanthine-guanine phosphoribosyltransferase